MFQGETAITIDDKGRLAIPAALRQAVADAGNTLVLTYNPFESGCLSLYTYARWQLLRDQVNALPMAKKSNRVLQLKLVGAATVLTLDGQGRISIPASLRNTVRIDRKAVLVGMGERLELWSEQAHSDTISQVLTDEDMSDELLDLAL